MADSFLDSLLDSAKKGLLQLSPYAPGQEQNPIQKAVAPAKQELETASTGLAASAKDIIQHPAAAASAVGHFGSEMLQGALELPDQLREAIRSQQQEADTPRTDPVTGRIIRNNDKSVVWPVVKAVGQTANQLFNPVNEIISLTRHSKLDANGNEVPLTPEETTQQLLQLAMKTEILGKASVHVPSLSEGLAGDAASQIDPILSKTRSEGEIKAAYSLMNPPKKAIKEFRGAYGVADPAKVERQVQVAGTRDLSTGSSAVPLAEGALPAIQEAIGKLGPIDRIVAGDDTRGVETAKHVVDANPQASQHVDNRWDSMARGVLEGLPSEVSNAEVVRRAKETPDEPIPGRGPLSTEDGESWNGFTRRVIDAAEEFADNHAKTPDETHVAVTHSDVLKTIQTYIDGDRQRGPDGQPVVDPDYFHMLESGAPGTVYRVGRDADGKLVMMESSGKGGGGFLLRHGITDWDEPKPGGTLGPDEGGLPRWATGVSDLMAKLPADVRDQWTRPLPKEGWIQERVAEFISEPAYRSWLEDYTSEDPAVANEAGLFHMALGRWLADPDTKIRLLEDGQDYHDLTPNELRDLQAGGVKDASSYSGKVLASYSKAVQAFTDMAELRSQQATTLGEKLDAMKTQELVQRMKQSMGQGAGSAWAKNEHWASKLENLRRAEIVGTAETSINIAKSHGFITLEDGADAINTSMLGLMRNGAKLISDAVMKGQAPDVQAMPSFRQTMGDALGYFQGIVSRLPGAKTEWDPAVFGIDKPTYDAIKSDYAAGLPIKQLPTSPAGPGDLIGKYGLSQKDLSRIVNGVTQRHTVDDILDALPLNKSRILGGYVSDIDAHIMGPQAALLSKSLEHTFQVYRDSGKGLEGLEAAWNSGSTDLETILKALPFEAMNGPFKSFMAQAGNNAMNAGKMFVDLRNTMNRAQMFELSRLQFKIHFDQGLQQLGMTEDEALTELRRSEYTTDPETGEQQVKPISSGLRDVVARAELASLKNTLRLQPKDGLLGRFLSAYNQFGRTFFPLTPFVFTFPRYMANYMINIADHSPTNMLSLFSKDFRADIMSGDALRSQEALRKLGRGMTGSTIIAAGYAMSQGHRIGGYTMGPKPYLFTKDPDSVLNDPEGKPGYLHIDTLGPSYGLLTAGHILDAAINGKPVNMTADEWLDFASGAKTNGVEMFSLHDQIQNLRDDDPNTFLNAAAKIVGPYLGSWTRTFKGMQDELNALNIKAPVFGVNPQDYLQKRDVLGQPLSGPTLRNVNPAALPGSVDAFTGRPDVEQHPGQAILRTEPKPMTPMERWMDELNVDTQKITANTKNPIDNNRLKAITGLLLTHPQLSQAMVEEATGLKGMDIGQLHAAMNSKLPQAGPHADINRQLQHAVMDQLLVTVRSHAKDFFEQSEGERLAAGQPSPYLSDKFVEENAQHIPAVAQALNKVLKEHGLR